MKREIKFRGLIKNGTWAYGMPCKSNYGIELVTELYHVDGAEWNEYGEDVNPETVGQFTGLKDKNGKEIYEGDILHIEYFKMAVGENLGVYEAEAELTGVVEFDTLSLVLQNIVGKKWEEYTGYDAGEGKAKFMYLGDVYEGSIDAEYQIEVIGNIYEHEYLIK